MNTTRLVHGCSAAVLMAAASTTNAQWTVVNLHPVGATNSQAWRVGGGQQVGYAGFGGQHRASLWRGTAASWVDLNPAGVIASNAYGVDGGQQAGSASGGGVGRASLWTGTAGSWVDLNPAGLTDSLAFGMHGSQQAGTALVGGYAHASLWSGTAASRVDLHAFLPSGFTQSHARGIWHDAGVTYVVGYGYNSTTARDEALMWVAPTCYPNCDGSTTPPILNVNDFICFLSSFAAGTTYANCDHSTTAPVLNVLDFTCFLNAFAAGCP